MKSTFAGLIVFLLAGLAGATEATVPVEFSTTQGTRWGESVYVLGDLPELGANDPARALRMVPGDHQRWSLEVALPEGVDYRYRYILRWNDPQALPDSGNARDASSERQARVPGLNARRRVRVRYLTGFAKPVIRYVEGTGGVKEQALQRIGPGRHGGESLFGVELDCWLDALTFVLHDGQGSWDSAPGGVPYSTGYADFSLASGRVHPAEGTSLNLSPAALDRLRSSAGGEVVQVGRWWSDRTGNARPLSIYLPRHYRSSQRRYPVLYVHDGQNVFGRNAMFGGWRLEQTADELIARGAIEELIIVGVGNTPQRMQEYVPEADGGNAGVYARFLAEELKPWIDANLRTRPEREHTGVCGSSLGGLVSLYIGFEQPHVFGKVASLSGSFWMDGYRPPARPRVDLKVWLDSGNEGGSADSLEYTLRMRDTLLRQGFVLGRDLQHVVDYGAAHSEPYWRARAGDVLQFLFPAR